MTSLPFDFSPSRANPKLALARDFAAVDRPRLELLARPVAAARSFARQLATWWRRAEERRQLLAMSHRDLRDIGLTRMDARMLADKPFWRA